MIQRVAYVSWKVCLAVLFAFVAIVPAVISGCSRDANAKTDPVSPVTDAMIGQGWNPHPFAAVCCPVIYVYSGGPNVASAELSWNGSDVTCSPDTLRIGPNGTVVWFTNQAQSFHVSKGPCLTWVSSDTVATNTHNVVASGAGSPDTCKAIIKH